MNHYSRRLRTLFTAVAFGALLFGCDDDEDDVVLPNGEFAAFSELDTDGNASLTLDEWNNFYDEWDLDGDGEIENDEWALDAPFEDVDANRDRVVDKNEYTAAFPVLDADNDGQITPDELMLE